MHTTDSSSEFTSTSVTQHFPLFPTLIQQLKLILEKPPPAWLFHIDKTSSLLWTRMVFKKLFLKIVIIAFGTVCISGNMAILRSKKAFLSLIQTYTEIIHHVVLQNCPEKNWTCILWSSPYLELVKGPEIGLGGGRVCVCLFSCNISKLTKLWPFLHDFHLHTNAQPREAVHFGKKCSGKISIRQRTVQGRVHSKRFYSYDLIIYCRCVRMMGVQKPPNKTKPVSSPSGIWEKKLKLPWDRFKQNIRPNFRPLGFSCGEAEGTSMKRNPQSQTLWSKDLFINF